MAILKTLSFGRMKKAERQQGRLIVLDGIDGSGKTTQINLLLDSLKAGGFNAEYIHFPQHGQHSASLVGDYLAGKFGPLNPYATSVFYAIDRFEASPRIRQWLAEGKVVIADRYVTANAGHQGGKIGSHDERIKFFRWLNNLEYEVFKIPKSDLNVILNLPAQVALNLVKQRNKRDKQNHVDTMHEVNLEHLRHGEEIYQEIGTLFPNTKVVECVEEGNLLEPLAIHNKIWELVRRIALKDLKPTQ